MDIAVPFYDGRKHQLKVPKDLGNIPEILPRYVGTVPNYSLALVAYTISSYTSTSGNRKGQINASLNVHFGVVLHEPGQITESIEEVSEEEIEV